MELIEPPSAKLEKDRLSLGIRAKEMALPALGVGLVGLLVCALLGFTNASAWSYFMHAYLLNCMYFLTLCLGALFFVLLQHVTQAGWSVVIRRVAELIANNIGVVGILCVPILLGMALGDSSLYRWVDAERLATDHL